MLMILATTFSFNAQIANYVNNGGFENVITGTNPPEAKYWRAIDSSDFFGVSLSGIFPPFQVPLSGYGYQWPKSGNNFFGTTVFFPTGTKRGYPLNRLKGKLVNGSTYCVKFYCNITDQSSYGIDAIGAYFGDSQVDTITYCTQPLTYLTPQIQNPSGNIITDTMHWVPITGTFVANGTEKYMIIGDFRSDVATNSVLINPSNLPDIFCDILIDDVSCIDIDLPAFAGRDTTVYPGNGIFIGREPDIGIDEACIWYKWPDMVNPIDTVAGFWINPTSTCTYVVKQQLWCNNSAKWDTIVIKTDFNVGIPDFSTQDNAVDIFPNPATDFMELKLNIGNGENTIWKLSLINSLGVAVREKEIRLKDNSFLFSIDDLPQGIYKLTISNYLDKFFTKKLVITK